MAFTGRSVIKIKQGLIRNRRLPPGWPPQRTIMKISITYRLFLAILTATAISVISMFLLIQWNIDRGFRRYIKDVEQVRMSRLTERLEAAFVSEGNWDFLRRDPELWRRLTEVSPGEDRRDVRSGMRLGPLHNREGRPLQRPSARRFELRVALLDSEKNLIAGPDNIKERLELRPLLLQDKIVGYLGLLPLEELSDTHQHRFLAEQRLALVLVAVVVVFAAAGLSLPLAGRLVRPVGAMAAAFNRLAAGQFDIRVPVKSSDELGQLARDFNALALTLEKNEQARRQWVADISHELRTPLAVLRGEIEALQDGIHQPTQDSIRSLHVEAVRLGRLVDDLYQLSLSDLGALTYRKETVNINELLPEILSFYGPEFGQKDITLTADLEQGASAILFGDPERLRQLFVNLLDNALKYTDRGGEFIVRLRCGEDACDIDFEDSEPGVPADELGKLFDRLYRVDASRTRTAGGAGLGLAICKNIVEAHGGAITAHASPLGGLWIKMTLPLTGRC